MKPYMTPGPPPLYNLHPVSFRAQPHSRFCEIAGNVRNHKRASTSSPSVVGQYTDRCYRPESKRPIQLLHVS